ncbi:MAG TPA: hypothetical protein VGO69_04190 [Pyrinomonadaceae bacterium]|nr:hypothetical protein [Pyrinomonadaceae bacterium]
MERAGVLNIESAGGAEAKRKPGFWQRQFQQQATKKQKVFDVVFGVTLPVLCFIFDPIVFRGNFIGGAPLFGKLQFLAYAIAFIEISTLLIWLRARERLGAHAVTVGGFLYTGALISLLIGIVLLPLSLIGLVFGIGILGFTPFVTFIVFWRNGRRAINLCLERVSRERKLGALVLGIIFVVGGPLAAHLKISQVSHASLTKILEGDAREAEEASEQLRLIGYLTYTNTDKTVWAYNGEQDQTRRARLARAYLKITGKDIEARNTYLFD